MALDRPLRPGDHVELVVRDVVVDRGVVLKIHPSGAGGQADEIEWERGGYRALEPDVRKIAVLRRAMRGGAR